jgi:hypothetical protein
MYVFHKIYVDFNKFETLSWQFNLLQTFLKTISVKSQLSEKSKLIGKNKWVEWVE